MSRPVDNPAGREAVATYVAERDALIAAAEPSPVSARAHADALDHAIGALAVSAELVAAPSRRWAVVALGGYGARRLLPWSDIDLLIAVDGRADDVRPFVEAMLYPLWDAGLAVGHSVRARRDAVASGADDIANLTAMMTGRVVAGDPGVAAAVSGHAVRKGVRRAEKVLTLLHDRARPGTPFELWPDLKGGRGGQRDLDELAWTASALSSGESTRLDALVDLGLIRSRDGSILRDAADVITGARWAAHVVHGKGDNRFDEDVAVRFSAAVAGINAAMAEVDRVVVELRAGTDRSRRGRAEASSDPADPSAFLAALADVPPRIGSLERAAWSGALDDAVPGFRDLMALRRPALSHRFTVGGHSVRAAALVAESAATDPIAAAVLADTDDRVLCTVAALLHDMGKREALEDHGPAGAPAAFQAALDLGLTPALADAVAALVSHHLVLAATAGSADIDDEDVVTAVATAVADPALVGPLYVLTMVDSLATGPDMWTPWKAALVGELAGKVERLLTDGSALTIAAEAAAVRDRVTELARFEQVPTLLVDFARHAPLRYLAEHSGEEVIDHARLAFTLAQGSRTATSRLEVRSGPMPGTWKATIVALDRPGLLATLAGVLALSGLDILGVAAHTTSRGVALDTFVVTGATLAEVDTTVWSRVERLLVEALDGKLAVPIRLAERRRHYRATERAVPVEVRLDTTGDFTTSVSVRTGDRVGLLHDLAADIAAAGLDIRSVTALTTDGVARDTFRMVDEFGEPPRDPELLDRLLASLRRRAGNVPTQTPTDDRSAHGGTP